MSDSRYLSFVEDRVMNFEPTNSMDITANRQADARSHGAEGAARADHKPNEEDLDHELEDEEEQERSR